MCKFVRSLIHPVMKNAKTLAAASIMLCGMILAGCCSNARQAGMIKYPVPERETGQTDVLQLRCTPIDTVRIGFIGLGNRGCGAIDRYLQIEGVKIVALCDLLPEYVDRAQQKITGAGLPAAAGYCSSPEDWQKVCQRDDIDLVYVCTDWVLHTPIAVYAMEHGKHVALEVPAALTIDECWQLVNTAEKTRLHCMMLENVCYDFFEMASLNMVQQGILGEIVHVEGAYIHDLEGLMFSDYYVNRWRLEYNAAHTGNPYPTHAIGPLCQLLDIHRGDRMEYLVSVSTGQFNMTEEATQRYGAGSPEAGREYKLGDMNTTVVRTARGKTIMIQHDVSNPRPYNRLFSITGTKGFICKYPVEGIALAPDAHNFLPEDKRKELMAKYEHPISKEIGEKAREVGGHGGMDFIMDYRLIYCLRNGLPLDQDVYDAAEWSSLVELTEQSVLNGGMPVEIPDFTRGAWDKIKGYSFATAQ